MKDKCFLDTNVFIYAIDTSPDLKEKRKVARHLIKEHIPGETGVISIQVLQEFYQVSTHKIQTPLSSGEALEYLHYMAVLDTVHPELEMLFPAFISMKNTTSPFGMPLSSSPL